MLAKSPPIPGVRVVDFAACIRGCDLVAGGDDGLVWVWTWARYHDAAILRRNYLAQLNKPFAMSAIPEVFLPHIFGCDAPDAGASGPLDCSKSGKELDMVRNFTTPLVTALVLGSVGLASARIFAPSIEHWTYQQSEGLYCYLPSWPCEQPTPRNISPPSA